MSTALQMNQPPDSPFGAEVGHTIEHSAAWDTRGAVALPNIAFDMAPLQTMLHNMASTLAEHERRLSATPDWVSGLEDRLGALEAALVHNRAPAHPALGHAAAVPGDGREPSSRTTAAPSTAPSSLHAFAHNLSGRVGELSMELNETRKLLSAAPTNASLARVEAKALAAIEEVRRKLAEEAEDRHRASDATMAKDLASLRAWATEQRETVDTRLRTLGPTLEALSVRVEGAAALAETATSGAKQSLEVIAQRCQDLEGGAASSLAQRVVTMLKKFFVGHQQRQIQFAWTAIRTAAEENLAGELRTTKFGQALRRLRNTRLAACWERWLDVNAELVQAWNQKSRGLLGLRSAMTRMMAKPKKRCFNRWRFQTVLMRQAEQDAALLSAALTDGAAPPPLAVAALGGGPLTVAVDSAGDYSYPPSLADEDEDEDDEDENENGENGDSFNASPMGAAAAAARRQTAHASNFGARRRSSLAVVDKRRESAVLSNVTDLSRTDTNAALELLAHEVQNIQRSALPDLLAMLEQSIAKQRDASAKSFAAERASSSKALMGLSKELDRRVATVSSHLRSTSMEVEHGKEKRAELRELLDKLAAEARLAEKATKRVEVAASRLDDRLAAAEALTDDVLRDVKALEPKAARSLEAIARHESDIGSALGRLDDVEETAVADRAHLEGELDVLKLAADEQQAARRSIAGRAAALEARADASVRDLDLRKRQATLNLPVPADPSSAADLAQAYEALVHERSRGAPLAEVARLPRALAVLAAAQGRFIAATANLEAVERVARGHDDPDAAEHAAYNSDEIEARRNTLLADFSQAWLGEMKRRHETPPKSFRHEARVKVLARLCDGIRTSMSRYDQVELVGSTRFGRTRALPTCVACDRPMPGKMSRARAAAVEGGDGKSTAGGAGTGAAGAARYAQEHDENARPVGPGTMGASSRPPIHGGGSARPASAPRARTDPHRGGDELHGGGGGAETAATAVVYRSGFRMPKPTATAALLAAAMAAEGNDAWPWEDEGAAAGGGAADEADRPVDLRKMVADIKREMTFETSGFAAPLRELAQSRSDLQLLTAVGKQSQMGSHTTNLPSLEGGGRRRGKKLARPQSAGPFRTLGLQPTGSAISAHVTHRGGGVRK